MGGKVRDENDRKVKVVEVQKELECFVVLHKTQEVL